MDVFPVASGCKFSSSRLRSHARGVNAQETITPERAAGGIVLKLRVVIAREGSLDYWRASFTGLDSDERSRSEQLGKAGWKSFQNFPRN